MKLADLQREHESEGIGRGLLGEIEAISRQVVSGYDPKIYGQAARWEEAIEDLVQDVVVDALIGERQLDYVMAVAADIAHFRRLVNKQVRRVLVRRRTRTVIDNLLSRSKKIAGTAPFTRIDIRGKWRFHMAGADPGIAVVSGEDIYRVARDIAVVPIVAGGSGERAPIVYTTENLKEILTVVESSVAGSVEVEIIDRILKKVLTPFLPTVLEDPEGRAGLSSRELGPEDRAMANAAIAQVLSAIDNTQRVVLRMKLTGASDTEVASAIGASRPTAANRRDEVTAMLLQAIEELDERAQLAALDGLAIGLLTEEAPDGR